MAKFGTGKLYTTDLLYGADPQFLLLVGNIASATGLGTPAIIPGPADLQGVGEIPSGEALGTPWIYQIPQRLALASDIRWSRVYPATRRLSTAPQITRLQVTSNA